MQKPADADWISSYLVIELVVEEVFPQRVREVQDSGDDDAEGGKQSKMEDYRIKLEASTQIISRRVALLREVQRGTFFFFFKVKWQIMGSLTQNPRGERSANTKGAKWTISIESPRDSIRHGKHLLA